MRTVIICHAEDPIATRVMARWLAASSELVGIVKIVERPDAKWRRLRNEFRRSGFFGFLDVMAFRVYYRAVLAARDRAWLDATVERFCERYPPLPENIPVFETASPNTAECERFLHEVKPDAMLALCKFILKPAIFNAASSGTFVLHPGVCPEYRNAHGCFWALARRDLDKVGMSMLKVDAGVDTGGVYRYFDYDYDEVRESHIMIQYSMTLENLDEIGELLRQIVTGNVPTIDTSGRESNVWGQPRLSHYLRWKSAARRLARSTARAGG